jgi:putative hydrolase of the HAD superfamily
MSELTAVVFDYGHVLSLGQPQTDVEEMRRLLCDSFDEHYWALRAPYDRGDMQGLEYWTEVARRCDLAMTPQLCEQLVAVDTRSWSVPNRAVLQLIEPLRQQGLRLGVLSNMPPELRQGLTGKGTWMPEFDHETYSCDIRVIKPDPAIYQHCLAGLDVAASKALFIDDRKENIDAAHEIGMQTIWATDSHSIARQIAEIFSLKLSV